MAVIEGALILLLGMAIGALVIAKFYTPSKKANNPYEKYKNKDGLYSRKVIRESR